MITPDSKIRVSILERIVPSLAFASAALSGAVGSVLLLRFLSLLRQAESAGYAAFYGGIAEVELVVGAVLVFAAVLSGIGILISIIRLFTTNKTSSPPGLLFLMMGVLSLAPPFALHYVMHMMKESVRSPDGTGIAELADTVTVVTYLAIGLAALIALVLLAFSFIPFSSRPGRKPSPLVCLILVAMLIAVLTGVYFWEARGSVIERDKDRTAIPSGEPIDPSTYKGDPDIIVRPENNAYPPPVDLDSNSDGNTVSGGVLNAKAISLPQPPYPAVARAVNATGSVTVQVLVDERGDVVSATALSGHALLRSAAVQAARQARFIPTKVSGKAVKVSGVLTYNFSGQ